MAKTHKTDAEWKEKLDDQQFHVTREKGTEAPFTGKYWNHSDDGTYRCVCCDTALFRSDTKYDPGCGWPSFWDAIGDGVIRTEEDRSLGRVRTEILCAHCDAHLGHVFPDGPEPSGLRYCINSLSLSFKKRDYKIES